MENNIGALKYMYKDLQFCGSIVIVFSMGIVVGFLEATLEKYLSRVGGSWEQLCWCNDFGIHNANGEAITNHYLQKNLLFLLE